MIPSNRRNNKKVVMRAVSENSYWLLYASNKLKNDKEVVMRAVSQNKTSLKYASDELKKELNDEIVTNRGI